MERLKRLIETATEAGERGIVELGELALKFEANNDLVKFLETLQSLIHLTKGKKTTGRKTIIDLFMEYNEKKVISVAQDL